MHEAINAILDVLILIAFLWFIDRLLVLRGDKGIFKRLMEAEGFKHKQHNTIFRKEDDYQYMFEKLCQVYEKTPLEMFKIARDEMGFGWSDERVEIHLSRWIKYGCKDEDLPNYVEAFIDKGKEYFKC